MSHTFDAIGILLTSYLIGMLIGEFLKIRSISGKIRHEFFDIAHGRSWQNFSKSEQEKLRGKLDSANFNFVVGVVGPL